MGYRYMIHTSEKKNIYESLKILVVVREEGENSSTERKAQRRMDEEAASLRREVQRTVKMKENSERKG